MGYLTKERVRMFLDISERSRVYVEKYFQLKKNGLYFSYTHLVCRTATPGYIYCCFLRATPRPKKTSFWSLVCFNLPDSPANRIDLSHPVHADNCVLTNDGKCIKDKPAFTWRDYRCVHDSTLDGRNKNEFKPVKGVMLFAFIIF